MVKCHNCGTGWTSAGLPLCPVCGTKVPSAEPAAAEPAPAAPPSYAAPIPAVSQEAVGKTASAVLEVPVKAEPAKSAPYSFPVIKRPDPPPPAASETPKPPEPFIFKTLKRAEEPPREDAPEKTPAAAPDVIAKEKPVNLQPIDASAANLPIQQLKELRISSRPLNGPLILGCLAYVSVLILPFAMAFESHRVIGILGFTLAGFFAPFAPIAWLVGLAAEKRRRDQGLRPEGRVTLGRLLGQWGTLLFVAQATVALIAIAAMRLSSKFPPTFWRGEF